MMMSGQVFRMSQCDLVWKNLVQFRSRHSRFLQLSLRLSLALTLHQSLGLSEEVGQQQLKRQTYRHTYSNGQLTKCQPKTIINSQPNH